MRVNFDFWRKHVLYSILLGYGVFANVGLILALTGQFQAAYLRLFSILVLIASWKTIANHLRLAVRLPQFMGSGRVLAASLFRENAFPKALTVLWLAVNLFIVFVPITGTDAKVYHVPIIFDVISTGQANFRPDIRYYHELPILAEIFYAVPTAIFNETAAPFVFQVLMYGALFLFILLFHNFLAQRLRHKFLAAASPLFLLSLFDLQREIFHGGYIDVFVFLFGLASTLLLLENTTRPELRRRELWLSAVLASIAVSMKYIALFFLAVNCIFLTVRFLRERTGIWALLKIAAIYLLIVFAVSGYWYIRNVFWFGNPVYPMFSSEEFRTSVGWFAMARTPLNFVLFPFYRFGSWFSDPLETSSHLVVFGYFALLYLLLAVFIFIRKHIGMAALLLFAFIELYLAFAFFTTHQIRFMLPALLMLGPLLALLLDRLYCLARERFGDRNYQRLTKVSMASANIFFLLMFLANFHYFHIRFLYTGGIYTREQYIGSIGSQ
ncbi:MAG: hypothetical protein HYT42_00100 [Candidatus Sungbacteria bacterium]|nr:hypothetical protein [Candidatus Sungbacteria bacterium]